MIESIVNEKTKLALEVFLNSPSHALLLTGRTGVGLDELANELAKKIAGGNIVRIKPKIHQQQKTENINFDDILGIRQLLRSRQKQALAIVVSQTEKMTTRAPEALLKLLEEPGENIHFIMTTSQIDKMPQTILSRTQIINVLPISAEKTNELISKIEDPQRRSQISFLAKNLPEEISKLSNNEEYFHQRTHYLEMAKAFLSKNTYERLKIVAGISKREDCLAFLDALSQIMFFLPPDNIKPENLSILSEVEDSIVANGNLKAQLTFLALSVV